MSKGSKQTQTQSNTSSTALDPRIQQAAYNNLDQANTVASNWNPTAQQAPAGFTADQIAGMNAARNAANQNVGGDTLNRSTAGLDSASNYQAPDATATGYTADNYGAGGYNNQGYDNARYDSTGYSGAQVDPNVGYQASMLGNAVQAGSTGYTAAQAADAQGYTANTGTSAQINRGNIQNVNGGSSVDQLNSYLQAFAPAYQSSVIDPALNDLNRARIMTQQGQDAQAATSGAFGGDRQAIYDAETNKNFADQASKLTSDLRTAGFNTALGSLNSDQQRQLQANLANQGADVSTYGQNAQLANSITAQNLGFQNQANQFGAQQANQFKLSNTDSQNQANQFAAQAQNAASLSNAAAQNAFSVQNQNAANAARATDSGLTMQGNLANQLSSNQANQFTAVAQNDANAAAAAATNTASQFNANAANQAGEFGANAQNAAGQFNAAQNNTAGQFGANAQNNASIANQNAAQSAANTRLNASNSLAQNATQERNNAFNNANTLQAVGDKQQAYNQSAQDIQYQNDLANNNADLTRLGIQQNALGLTPYGTTTNSSGTGTSSTSQGLGTTIMNAAGAAAGSYAAVKSDERLKTNIKPMFSGSAMSRINKMNGVAYDWKKTGAHDLGLVAQDVEKAMPGSVKAINGVKHYSSPAVLGLLTEGIKELDRKISKKKGLLT